MKKEILEKDIPDLNIFMMCSQVNEGAFCKVPKGFHIRRLKREELDVWKRFPFDSVDGDISTYIDYMTQYYNDVYLEKEDLFYDSCLVICDTNDQPVGTCFAWKAYGKVWTIHWLKVYKEKESKGLGRAILTEVMMGIPKEEFPVYLHTQPGSFRAIKLYSDFGFKIIKDKTVGNRANQYKQSLKYLKYFMGDYYKELKFVKTDGSFGKIAKQNKINEF